MGSAAPAQTASPDRAAVKRMLAIFAVLAIAGVLMLAVSVALGLVLLVVAEAFFVVAYRRFSARPKRAA